MSYFHLSSTNCIVPHVIVSIADESYRAWCCFMLNSVYLFIKINLLWHVQLELHIFISSVEMSHLHCLLSGEHTGIVNYKEFL